MCSVFDVTCAADVQEVLSRLAALDSLPAPEQERLTSEREICVALAAVLSEC